MKESKSNARRMAALVDGWGGSGQTLSAFARTHGVTRDKLVYWCRRMGAAPRRGKRSKPREVSFAPVELLPAPAPIPAVEVMLPGGMRLAIGSSATPELVRAVIEVLRRC